MKIGYTLIILGIMFIGIIGYSNYSKLNSTGNSILDQVEITGGTIPIDTEKSVINFEGSGDDGEHLGIFKEWEGVFFIENGKIIGVRGKINTKSAKTGNYLLDKGLQGKDFFNSDFHPYILFSGFLEDPNNTESPFIIGEVTMRGITMEQDFGVDVNEDSIKGELRFNSKDYEFGNGQVIGQLEVDFEFYK